MTIGHTLDISRSHILISGLDERNTFLATENVTYETHSSLLFKGVLP